MPFNIGPGELLLILAIALLVIGPGRLPDVGAALGKSLREFRKASTEMQEAVTSATKTTATAAAVPAPSPRRDRTFARRDRIGAAGAAHSGRAGQRRATRPPARSTAAPPAGDLPTSAPTETSGAARGRRRVDAGRLTAPRRLAP